jgi:hypothetical protein
MTARVLSSFAVLATLACAPPAAPPSRTPPSTIELVPPTPIALEDRPDNPSKEWIVGDWTTASRPTRVKLVQYVHDADTWTARCKAGYADLANAAGAIESEVKRRLAAIPSAGSPYDAFDAFRAVHVDALSAGERLQRERSLAGWEVAFFVGPIDESIKEALVDWERRSSPYLSSAASTKPLGGARIPTATVDDPTDREGSFCSHSRDHGTVMAPVFTVPAELRDLVRRPFERVRPVAPIVRAPPADPPAYPVTGVVRSVSSSSAGTLVGLEWTSQMMKQVPPCHVVECTGIDCGMVPGGRKQTVCTNVSVTVTAAFDALFAELPRGLTLQRGDTMELIARESQTFAPPLVTHYHPVVLSTVDRGGARVFSLVP